MTSLGEVLHRLAHPGDRDLHQAIDDLCGQDGSPSPGGGPAQAGKSSSTGSGGKEGESA